MTFSTADQIGHTFIPRLFGILSAVKLFVQLSKKKKKSTTYLECSSCILLSVLETKVNAISLQSFSCKLESSKSSELFTSED